jgi:hypothetical protein
MLKQLLKENKQKSKLLKKLIKRKRDKMRLVAEETVSLF